MKEVSVVLTKGKTKVFVSVYGISITHKVVQRKPWLFVVRLGGLEGAVSFKEKKDALDRFYKRIGYLVTHGYYVQEGVK